MAKTDLVILHDFKAKDLAKPGATKPKYSILVESDPILHDFDEIKLGRGVAMALEAELKAQISGQTDHVRPSTLKRRQQYQRAFTAPQAKPGRKTASPGTNAQRQYSGGRTGATPPNKDGQGRWLYDSGRLAGGLSTREVRKINAWVINVPANRLNPQLFGRNFQWFLSEFQRRVDLEKIRNSQKFKAALQESLDDLMQSAVAGRSDRQWRKLMAQLGFARSLTGLLAV